MKPHAPLLPGRDDINQLELIYQLLGTPSGEVEAHFKSLPHWNKMVFQRTYTPRLNRKFGGIFDTNTLQLLSRLLEMDPNKRISAAAALDTEYFWNDPAPNPENLPIIAVEAAFALSEDERMREEHRLKQLEKQRLEDNRIGNNQSDGQLQGDPNRGDRQSQGGRTNGRLLNRGGRGGRIIMAPSKYSVSKPSHVATSSFQESGKSGFSEDENHLNTNIEETSLKEGQSHSSSSIPL